MEGLEALAFEQTVQQADRRPAHLLEGLPHRRQRGRDDRRRLDVVDHLWIGVEDVPTARRFYEQAAAFTGFSLATVLAERVHFAGANASFGLVAREATENVHLAFETHDHATVDAFHAELTSAGYRDNGPPGERHYHPGYYGAFVLDPDGNNVEVVNHAR